MAQPAAWRDDSTPTPEPAGWGNAHPAPLAVDTAPVPAYGTGSLADLLPTLAAGQGVPGFTHSIPELTPPTGTASS